MAEHGPVSIVSKLAEVDPVFREVCDLLFDGAVDPRELMSKAMPDASSVHVNGISKKDKKKKSTLTPAQRKERSERTQARVGLASNALGITAGGAALGAAAQHEGWKKGTGRTARMMVRLGEKTPKPLARAAANNPKLAAGLAAGATGLQAANLGGDLVANRVLARAAKKKVEKALVDIVQARREGVISTETAIRLSEDVVTSVEKGLIRTVIPNAIKGAKRARLRRVAPGAYRAGKASGYRAGKSEGLMRTRRAGMTGLVVGTGAGVGGTMYYTDSEAKKKALRQVQKSHTVPISKRDDEQQLIFGWCSISKKDGKDVIDLQGDFIPIDEIEKTAYTYALESRVGGEQHARDGEHPLKVSDMVESFVATPEKLAAMGLPEDAMPHGWWIGFKVNDPETWAGIKDGTFTDFSIHGSGVRKEIA